MRQSITCPKCETTLRTSKPIPAGRGVQCPKCNNRFVAPSEKPDSPSPRETATETPSASNPIRFACPNCGKSYLAPAANAGQSAPCRKCGFELTVPSGSVVRSSSPTQITPPKAAPPKSQSDEFREDRLCTNTSNAVPSQWFCILRLELIGPLTWQKLLQLVGASIITFDTLIRKGDDGEWMTADRVDGLHDPLRAADVQRSLTQPETDVDRQEEPGDFLGFSTTRNRGNDKSPHAEGKIAQSRGAIWLMVVGMLFLASVAWLAIVYWKYPTIPVTEVQITPGPFSEIRTRTYVLGLNPFYPPWIAGALTGIVMTFLTFRCRGRVRRFAWGISFVAIGVTGTMLPLKVEQLTQARMRAFLELKGVYAGVDAARSGAGDGINWFRAIKSEDVFRNLEHRRFPNDPVTGAPLIYFDDLPDRAYKEPFEILIVAAFPAGPDGIQAVLTAVGGVQFVRAEEVDESRGILKRPR